MDAHGYLTPEEYQAEYEGLIQAMALISFAYQLYLLSEMNVSTCSDDLLKGIEDMLKKEGE